MICTRPGCKETENRINGYCSIYCRDIHDLEVDLRNARANYQRCLDRIEALEKELRALRAKIVTQANELHKMRLRRTNDGPRLERER